MTTEAMKRVDEQFRQVIRETENAAEKPAGARDFLERHAGT
jgi:hypothetical protein